MGNKIYIGKVLEIKAKKGVEEEVTVLLECILRKERIEVLGVKGMFNNCPKNSYCVFHINEVGFPDSSHVIKVCAGVKSVTKEQLEFLEK